MSDTTDHLAPAPITPVTLLIWTERTRALGLPAMMLNLELRDLVDDRTRWRLGRAARAARYVADEMKDLRAVLLADEIEAAAK